MQSFDITTVLFAALAIFVIWKLRSVLGTRTGTERPPVDPYRKPNGDARPGAPADGEASNVIRVPGAAAEAATGVKPPVVERWKDYAAAGTSTYAALEAIAARDPSFDIKQFLSGAQSAYEIIVTAFGNGDRKTLKPLLASDVYDNFESVIAQKERDGHKTQTTIVSIGNSALHDAQMRGNDAQLAVKFASKLISVTRDRAENVVDGSPDKVVDMVDVWTFARDVRSGNPNWRLIATDAGHA